MLRSRPAPSRSGTRCSTSHAIVIGSCTTGTRSASGSTAGCCSPATPRIRCCSISRRARANPSRTPGCCSATVAALPEPRVAKPRRLGRAAREFNRIRAPHTARVQRTARLWGESWHVDGIAANATELAVLRTRRRRTTATRTGSIRTRFDRTNLTQTQTFVMYREHMFACRTSQQRKTNPARPPPQRSDTMKKSILLGVAALSVLALSACGKPAPVEPRTIQTRPPRRPRRSRSASSRSSTPHRSGSA